MPAVFITGTGTDVGKTYVTAGLVRALRALGVQVDVLKPVVSGFDPGAPQGSDPAVLLEALGRPWSPAALDQISPWRFAAPLSPPLAARREERALDARAVIDLCRERAAEAGDRLLLIEGAGGVMSPLDDDHTMLDLATALALPCLLVAGSYLGTISHTLTAAGALRAAGATLLAVAVSESLESPPMDETFDSLARLLAGAPAVPIPRGGEVPSGLARRLLPS
jgi:dethiobiotin synthetase